MKITYANGDKYEGQLSIGNYHGKGKLIYANNQGEYTGEFCRGRANKQGTRIFANGNKYVGMFSDGELHGDGIMFYANGDQYIGEFSRGFVEGKGVIRYNRGDRYEGTFMKGFIYGEGKYNYPDGGYYSGEYKNIKVNSYTQVVFPQYSLDFNIQSLLNEI